MSSAASAVFTAHLHNVNLLQSYLTSPPVLSTHVHAHSYFPMGSKHQQTIFYQTARLDDEHLFVFSWKLSKSMSSEIVGWPDQPTVG